jgi:hypothetical protein
MAIDERARHELHRKLEEVLGADEAATLMSHLPPVGWADVATKHDLAQLEDRVNMRFDMVDRRFEAIDLRFDAMDDSMRWRSASTGSSLSSKAGSTSGWPSSQ